jgi:outer membrane protein assembly factor BamA
MLPFAEGQRYRARQIQEGQRNLYQLELIQSARIVQDLEEGDTIVPVEVVVAEGQKHRVRTGVGWTTLDCLNAEARWSSRNFFGGARRLTVRGRVSNILAEEMNATACSQAGSGAFAELNGQLSVELFQPWLISPRNSFALNAFVERQSVPSVFIRRALGLNVALSRNLGRRMQVTLGWRPTLTQLDAAEIFLCSSFLACIPSDLEIFQNANWLSPLGVRLSQDWRNSILNPTEGYTWLVDLEWAEGWTGSDFSYGRAVVEGSFYHEFEELGETDGIVVATRLRGGVVGQGRFEADTFDDVTLVHPQKRFFSGGANSVRGFTENQLGPRVLTTPVQRVLGVPEGEQAPACTPGELVDGLSCDPSELPDDAFSFRPVGGTWVLEANLEVRFPLFTPKLQGVAFVDAGQVWLDREEFEELDLAWSPGVGVRYMSPIGPIRVDLGYGARDPERLPVAVRGIRAFDPETDAPGDRLTVPWVNGEERTLDWVATDNLQFVFPSRTFGDRGDFWDNFWNRLQLHISLGQAF